MLAEARRKLQTEQLKSLIELNNQRAVIIELNQQVMLVAEMKMMI